MSETPLQNLRRRIAECKALSATHGVIGDEPDYFLAAIREAQDAAYERAVEPVEARLADLREQQASRAEHGHDKTAHSLAIAINMMEDLPAAIRSLKSPATE